MRSSSAVSCSLTQSADCLWDCPLCFRISLFARLWSLSVAWLISSRSLSLFAFSRCFSLFLMLSSYHEIEGGLPSFSHRLCLILESFTASANSGVQCNFLLAFSLITYCGVAILIAFTFWTITTASVEDRRSVFVAERRSSTVSWNNTTSISFLMKTVLFEVLWPFFCEFGAHFQSHREWSMVRRVQAIIILD